MSNAVHPFFHDFPAKQKYVIQILFFFFICEKNEKNSAQLSVSVTSYTNILPAKKCATKGIQKKIFSLTNHKISTQLYIIGTCNIKPAANSGSPALVYVSGKTRVSEIHFSVYFLYFPESDEK